MKLALTPTKGFAPAVNLTMNVPLAITRCVKLTLKLACVEHSSAPTKTAAVVNAYRFPHLFTPSRPNPTKPSHLYSTSIHLVTYLSITCILFVIYLFSHGSLIERLAPIQTYTQSIRHAYSLLPNIETSLTEKRMNGQKRNQITSLIYLRICDNPPFVILTTWIPSFWSSSRIPRHSTLDMPPHFPSLHRAVNLPVWSDHQGKSQH